MPCDTCYAKLQVEFWGNQNIGACQLTLLESHDLTNISTAPTVIHYCQRLLHWSQDNRSCLPVIKYFVYFVLGFVVKLQ